MIRLLEKVQGAVVAVILKFYLSLLFFLVDYFFKNCYKNYVYVNTPKHSACGSQNCWKPLELEWQVVVSCLMWVLRTQLWSCAKQYKFLTTKPAPQASGLLPAPQTKF